MSDPEGRRGGRPKDTSIDARALDATRRLLVEEGFAATTIQAVAERSGAHASALYRRWPSRLELIEEAVLGGLPPSELRPTGDLRADLQSFVGSYLEVFRTPLLRAAIPGLLASYRAGEGPARSSAAWQRLSLRPAFAEVLAAAPPGAIDPALDADDVFDLLLGAVLVRVMVPSEARRFPPVDRVVDLLLRVLRPEGDDGRLDDGRPDDGQL